MNPIARTACVVLVAAVPTVTLAQDPTPSARWELNGIALGATQAQVEALAPGLACTTEGFDAGLATCRDANATLADKPALLRVRLLDDRVVLVELARLRPKQVRAAHEALAQKFGPPSRTAEVTHRPAFGDHVVRDVKHVWEDGSVQLIANPLAPRADGGFPDGAVVLLDVARHDGEWLGRLRTQGKGRAAADAIGL